MIFFIFYFKPSELCKIVPQNTGNGISEKFSGGTCSLIPLDAPPFPNPGYVPAMKIIIGWSSEGYGLYTYVTLYTVHVVFLQIIHVLKTFEDLIIFYRLVYYYGYSPDRSLRGYVNNSLTFINISDLEQSYLPDNPLKNLNYTLPYCR